MQHFPRETGPPAHGIVHGHFFRAGSSNRRRRPRRNPRRQSGETRHRFFAQQRSTGRPIEERRFGRRDQRSSECPEFTGLTFTAPRRLRGYRFHLLVRSDSAVGAASRASPGRALSARGGPGRSTAVDQHHSCSTKVLPVRASPRCRYGSRKSSRDGATTHHGAEINLRCSDPSRAVSRSGRRDKATPTDVATLTTTTIIVQQFIRITRENRRTFASSPTVDTR